MSVKVKIRPANKSDIPFITNSWLESFRKGNLCAGVADDLYFPWHHKVLDQLVARSKCWVLCNQEDEYQILAWVCAEFADQALIIHYLYVKQPFRRSGFASALVKALMELQPVVAVMYTHKTGGSRYALEAKGLDKEWIYNPYWMFASLPEGWSGMLPIKRQKNESRN